MGKKLTTSKDKKKKKSNNVEENKSSPYQIERDVFDDHGPVIIGTRIDKPKL